jgi:hypothetical protein
MRSARWFGVLSLLVIGAWPAAAKNICIPSATSAARECNSGCVEGRQSAVDACLNRDHACVEACRAGREDCVQATGLEAALDACNATQTAAVHQCRLDNPKGSPERDACIDQAQLVGFQCRKAAQKSARLAMRACRTGFRACARACGPLPQPDRAAVPQCRKAAQAVAQTCHLDCVEDFQVAKDACRNRDHACVEQCRTDREACAQPILVQLAADIAACNAARDAGADNCRSLYGDGTSERALCIQNVQATAFECRDGKREVARPQLRVCRDTFNTCARACPPPQP